MIDACDAQLAPLDRELRRYAQRQPGCVALRTMFGVGPLISAAILGELGDARRFSSSRHAVRFAGLDITVYSSDARRSPGRLSRQGSSVLRWAVYEAAQTAVPARLARPRLLPHSSRHGSGRAAPRSRSRASCCAVPITSCASSATPRSAPRPDQDSQRAYRPHSS